MTKNIAKATKKAIAVTQSQEAVAAEWKMAMRKELEGHYAHFPGDPIRSVPWMERMIDRGFFTLNSQEGMVEHGALPLDMVLYRKADCDYQAYSAKGGRFGPLGTRYSERAYVCGLMPEALALRFSYFLNLTDKVAIVDSMGGIPVTYADCFEGVKGVTPPKGISPGTWITAEVQQSDIVHDKGKLSSALGGQAISFVQCFDPKHGRAARRALYPDVVRSLDLAHE